MEIYITIFIFVLGLLNPYCNKTRLLIEILADLIIEISGICGISNIEEYYTNEILIIEEYYRMVTTEIIKFK